MSDFFYRTLSRIIGYLALATLMALYAFSANLEIKDFDLWLHLKVGKFIVEHGYIPAVDILSNSIAGKPWINHEWLFQVVVYIIHNLWGFDGLITMQVAVVLFTIGILLLLGYNAERQIVIILTLILVLFNYQMRFTIRPDIFSLLFFAIYMHILSIKLDQRWSVVALFLVQVLWANMHGFFFFGPVFVSMAVIAEFLKRNVKMPYEWNRVGRLTDEEYKRLQLIWFVVIGACFINPYFLKGAVYPIEVLTNISGDTKTFFKYIVELQRPIPNGWKSFFAKGDYVHYRILIFLSFMSFVFNRRRLDIGAFLFWLVFLVFSLAAVRNLVFFSFAAYLVILVNTMNIHLDDILPLRFTHARFKHITAIFIKGWLIFWMIDYGSSIMNNGYFDYDTFQRKSEFQGVSKRNFPYHAVDFLVANKVKGNFFNDFNSGAYLIGRTYPSIKVFIDGRTEVYGADFFNNKYMKVWHDGDEKVFEELDKTSHFTGAFLNSNAHQIPDKVATMFYHMKDWVPVYFDYDGMIFLRKIPQNQALIDRYKIDFKTWKPPELDLMRLGSRPIGPKPQIDRAYTLYSLELYDLALKEIDMAVKIAPDNTEIFKLRAKIYENQKKYRKAFENYRIVASYFPSDVDIRGKLGQAYENLGDLEGAINQFKKTIDYAPNDARGYYSLARALARDKQIEKSRVALRRAINIAPDNTTELLKVGDIIYEQKNYDLALKIYSKALDANKDMANVHHKVGRVLMDLKDYDKAQMHFKKGLAVDKDNKDLKRDMEDLKDVRKNVPPAKAESKK
jgi:tetratricopeptide (TPR) repeat protein